MSKELSSSKKGSTGELPGSGSNSPKHSTSSKLLIDDDPSKIWDDLPKKYRTKKRGAYIRKHNDVKVSSNLHIFKLVMWKNFIVMKRRWKSSLVQFASPILLITIICMYVTRNPSEGYYDQIYSPFSVENVHNDSFKDCDTFYLTPKCKLVDDLIVHLKRRITFKQFKYDYLEIKPSEPTPAGLCALIQFNNVKNWNGEGPLPDKIDFEIRFPAVYDADERSSLLEIGRMWDTQFFHPPILVDGSRELDDNTGGHPDYFKNGFLFLQNLLSIELIEISIIIEGAKHGYSESEMIGNYKHFRDKLDVKLQRFPFPGHEGEQVAQIIHEVIPPVLFVGFAVSAVIMVYTSVREKETGIRTLLKMYGVDAACHQRAELLHNLILLSLSAFCITLILSTQWTSSLKGSYLLSKKYLSEMFFMLLFFYLFNIITTVILFDCMFTRASSAAIGVALFWTMTFVPYLYIKRLLTILTPFETALSTVSEHTVLGMGCLGIAELQAKNDHYGWKGIFKNKRAIGWLYLSLLSTGIFKMLLARYISRVFPEKGMTRMPWNYIFKSWWWNDEMPPEMEVPLELSHEKSFAELNPKYFEDDDDTKKRKQLCIENVSKYNGGVRKLHKINLICYQDYATLLIGDEGCGKSVLLKILSGMSQPSSGIIYLSKKDLYKNLSMARAFVGYCPSHNQLYPDMTVAETIEFFTDLKGLSNRIEAYEEVERILKGTLLRDCRNTMVSKLSKSTQRMLMVATAFCAGSRVVLLDDPDHFLTSTQKRLLWQFVGQEKKHRTVVIAMDSINEVDAIVDKLVLFNNGQITATGSLEGLAQRFGGGYHLEIKTLNFVDEIEIEDFITRRVAGSALHSKTWNGRKLTYYLPASQSAFFPGVFEELERYKLSYGIADLNIKYISLEELYISLKRLQSPVHKDNSNENFESEGVTSMSLISKLKSRHQQEAKTSDKRYFPTVADVVLEGQTLHYWHEFKKMFNKNAKFMWRNKPICVLSIFIPVILVINIYILTLKLQLSLESAKHEYSLERYAKPHIWADLVKGTNEGVPFRVSIHNFFEYHGVNHKEISHEDDLQEKMLNEYFVANNENEVSLMGLQIYKAEEKEGKGKKATTQVKVGLIGYFNNQFLHTPAAVLSLLHNVLLRHVHSFLQRNFISNYTIHNYSLDVSNHPLPLQPEDIVKHSEILIGPGYLFGVFLSFIFSFLFPFYIIMHIKEQDFRHLQFMLGANKLIFWFTNYLWNFLHFTVVVILQLGFLAIVGIPGFSHVNWDLVRLLWTMFILLEIYGIAGICMIGSIASRHFKSWSTEFSKLALIFILTGPCMMMMIIPLRNSYHFILFTFAHNVLLISPSYSFGVGVSYIIANSVHNTECKNYHVYKTKTCDQDFSIHPFNEFHKNDSIFHACCFNRRDSDFSFVAYGIGRNILMLIIVILISIGHKVFTYSKMMRKLQKKMLDRKAKKWIPVSNSQREVLNYDVLAEMVKVYRRSPDPENDSLVIRNLTLETKSRVKLEDLSFEVEPGECFGLVGSPGAGKSTFLKLVSGYPGLMPTYGDVEYCDTSLMNNYDKYLHQISYCPDESPFLDELTGQDVLELIGTINKLSPDSIEDYIAFVSDKFDMIVEMEQQTKKYHFWLIKKLCFATAMMGVGMGKHNILLMDSPARHLDPKTKELINLNVKHAMENGCAVIWASNRIDHVESILTKMSIMVNGRLRCFGTLSHLKEQFETGFTIIVKFILDKDLIYFTSKANVWMENEIREDDIDEDTGLPIAAAKYEERKKNLMTALQDDEEVEKALTELDPWEQDLCPFMTFFEKFFPNAILVDKQPGFIHYHVKEKDASWSQLFTKLEEAKAVGDVESYSVCCTSLEQVFFHFSRGQITIELDDA